MRRLIVCCDGTWNTQDQEHDGIPVPTNVVRMFHSAQDWQRDRVKQLKYYHPGVGTEGGKLKQMLGGGLGLGLNQNIQSAYYWLARNYRPGDQIFMFGFSRGAYTVRSLGGMICTQGLLNLAGVPADKRWKRVKTLFKEGYRKRRPLTDWGGAWSFHSGDPEVGQVGGDQSEGCNGVGIHFLGVWDTVGAVGIPDDAALLNLLDDEAGGFHDTKLSDAVVHARHALALDEERASFSPTLWTDVDGRDSVKQLWFPGAHSDVGGGYVQKGLSDCALKWMMDEAAEQGLQLDPKMVAQVTPNYQDVAHDSATGIFAHLPTQPRNIPNFPSTVAAVGAEADEQEIEAPSPLLHESAVERHQDPPISQAIYHPTIKLAVGEKTKVDVYAIEPWNRTGIYLEKGAHYKLSARGQWMDKNIKSLPDGTTEDGLHFGEMVRSVGTALGMMENLFKKATGNEDADFKGTRREEGMPWFSLVGAVANAGNPEEDGTPGRHQIFEIGNGREDFGPTESGYLYAFANDAWNFYSNNRGSVRLIVERTS